MKPLAVASALVGILGLLATSAFAVAPDVGSDPGNSATGTERPYFRLAPADADLLPDAEGADPRPPATNVDPKVVITGPAEPIR